MVVDPTLKAALEQSPLLTEEVKQKLLAAAEKGLTSEQLQGALEALKNGNDKYGEAKAVYDAKVKEINEKHLAELKRVVPQVMHAIEQKDRERDTQSAEQLFNQL